MIVGACGFGSTGSSAVCDYLLEFNRFNVLDGVEFGVVSDTDGLIDLAEHVMYPHNRTSDSIIAIERYLQFFAKKKRYYTIMGGIDSKSLSDSMNKFIKAITQVSWYSYGHIEEDAFFNHYIKGSILRQRLIPFIERKLSRAIYCYPMKKVNFSVMPDNFYEAARKHVKELLGAMGADFSKGVILDQPFSGNNPQAAFPFYDDPYAIVVDRDPRDNYVFAKTRLVGVNHFMPTESVEAFVEYFRRLRDNQPYKEPNERVLSIKFEDMVYDYDNATKIIRDFLKLPENPNPKSIFDPAVSIVNTQVYKRFPQYAKDIDYIEQHLGEYLFDFDKYGDMEIRGDMFYGKSPKNKR